MTTITAHAHADGRLTIRTEGHVLDLALDLRPGPFGPTSSGYIVMWRGARIGTLIHETDSLGDVWTGHLLDRVVSEGRTVGDAAVALAVAWLHEELEGLARQQTAEHRRRIGEAVSVNVSPLEPDVRIVPVPLERPMREGRYRY